MAQILETEHVSSRFSREHTGRADLVRWLQHSGESTDSLDRIAGLAGFERRRLEPAPVLPEAEDDLYSVPSVSARDPGATHTIPPTSTSPKVWWYAVATVSGTPATPDGRADYGPLCLRGVAPLSDGDLRPTAERPQLSFLPMVPWARLWPFLKGVLGASTQGAIDVPRVADMLAERKLPRRLPRQFRKHWAPEAQVLLDFDCRLASFARDFNDLCFGLVRLRGKLGLQLWRLCDNPGGAVRPWGQSKAPQRPWTMPAPGTPVLICSDLGLLAGSDSSLHYQWIRMGRSLLARGIRPQVLAPVSPEHLTRTVLRIFDVVCFTSDIPLRPCRAPGPALEGADLADLQALLSPAVRIEPTLLRAAVRLLAPKASLAGVESSFWNHADVEPGYSGCEWNPAAAHRHRTAFSRLAAQHQRGVLSLMHKAHAHCVPAVIQEETLVWASLVAPQLMDERAMEVERAVRFFHSVADDFYSEGGALPAAKRDYARRVLARSDATLRARNASLSVLYAAAYRQALLRGESVATDEGLDRGEIMRALGEPAARPTVWDVVQRGDTLGLLPELRWTDTEIERLRVSSLARLHVTVPLVDVQTSGPAGGRISYPLGRSPVALTPLAPEALPVIVRTGNEEVTVCGFPRPTWARAIGRDAEGLWCDVEWLGRRVRLRWGPREDGPEWGWQENGGVGVDAFGLYADFTVKSVTQRCRWIAPGTFLMGSPPEEGDRSDNETQHEVTLTRGYWLADTACTQALWQAVMGDNPSHYKDGPTNPVEQVNWDDIQVFLARLNELVPGLAAGLPSEAQWENACRAGTTTPFSFGQNITPEQVNYDGNNPYADGKKGLDRERTVPVKSLPPNPWGLYEMHGNVWEWCADWYGDYPKGPQIDPPGPPEGVHRVLRGGSWDCSGRLCRAAYRGRDGPGYRGITFGFRLAPGQRPGPAGQEAARRAEGASAMRSVAEQAPAERAGPVAGGAAGEKGILRRVLDRFARANKKP